MKRKLFEMGLRANWLLYQIRHRERISYDDYLISTSIDPLMSSLIRSMVFTLVTKTIDKEIDKIVENTESKITSPNGVIRRENNK